MFAEFEESEVATILAAVGPGPIANKLTAKPHPDTEAFASAADRSSDYVHVPTAPLIDRTRNGAYVLVWMWIYNEQAGVDQVSDFDDFAIKPETLRSLEALRHFRLESFRPGEANGIIGALDTWYWSVEVDRGALKFYVGANERCPSSHPVWWYSKKLRKTRWRGHKVLSQETYFSFILEATERFRDIDQQWRHRFRRWSERPGQQT
jgi:hypothetical protein